MVREFSLCFVLGLFLSSTLLACGDDKGTTPSTPTPVGEPCIGGEAPSCDGDTYATCVAGERVTQDCAAAGQLCFPSEGCVACLPGVRQCDGQTQRVCVADGSAFEETVCDAELGGRCEADSGSCVNPCKAAEQSGDFIGCEYRPVPLYNSGIGDHMAFDFRIAIQNPGTEYKAEIEITRGEKVVSTLTLNPGQLGVTSLPWIEEMQDLWDRTAPSVAFKSKVTEQGEYRLRSTAPVLVYQFNPWDYEVPFDCFHDLQAGFGNPEVANDDKCLSYSNDSSLLLPVHAMGTEYRGLSFYPSGAPGYLAVSNPQDEAVTLTVKSTGILEGTIDDPFHEFPGAQPGETVEYDLPAGAVIHLTAETLVCNNVLFCGEMDADPAHDLTGTTIKASAPVQVFGGHACAYTPLSFLACDHLEETLFPVDLWGRTYFVPMGTVLRENNPKIVRVVSASDGNEITVTPDGTADSVTLDDGEWIEFRMLEGDVRVDCSERCMVGQFLPGQQPASLMPDSALVEEPGDPAMGIIIPQEQYRASYAFIGAASYQSRYATITANIGQTVMLDGEAITDWTANQELGFATANVEVSPGVHRMESEETFGLMLSGYGKNTSFFHPAGLDLIKNIPD